MLRFSIYVARLGTLKNKILRLLASERKYPHIIAITGINWPTNNPILSRNIITYRMTGNISIFYASLPMRYSARQFIGLPNPISLL